MATDGDKLGALAFLMVILIVVLFAFNPIVQVNAGYRGILLTFGAVTGVLPEGLNFKIPFIQAVEPFEVRTQKYEVSATSASSDMQDVYTIISINYRPDSIKVGDIYKNTGTNYAEKIIAPAVQEATKAATAKYKAEDLIDQRTSVKDIIQTSLTERLSKYDIIVETVNIIDFKFSEQYTQAIEQKVTSQQTKLNEEQILFIKRIQAEQALAEAQGRANSNLAIATAEANATIIKAQAESQAIQLISQTLAKEPTYIDYITRKQWDGKLPLVTGGGAVPFINISS
jgi:prohibitin 2